ncbi:hypothetical protein B0O80DRAFT_492368 [Mortierella sp. GBAus27b]|nr:hypothetical protein BGX31_004379 [Mortierella sp. GBA43]KAI8363223.1 hypothetical protein B0O80DRAFT_492368 [Mortierella sp. GBAus27b]
MSVRPNPPSRLSPPSHHSLLTILCDKVPGPSASRPESTPLSGHEHSHSNGHTNPHPHHHARHLDRGEKREREVEMQEYDLNAIRLDIIRMQGQFDSRMQRTERAIENLVEAMMYWRQDFVSVIKDSLEIERAKWVAAQQQQQQQQQHYYHHHHQDDARVDCQDNRYPSSSPSPPPHLASRLEPCTTATTPTATTTASPTHSATIVRGDSHRALIHSRDHHRDHDNEDVDMTSGLKDDLKELECTILSSQDSLRDQVTPRLDSIQAQVKDLSERLRVQQHVVTNVVQQYHQHVQLQQRQAQQCQELIQQLQQPRPPPIQIQSQKRPVGRPRKASLNSPLRFIAYNGKESIAAAAAAGSAAAAAAAAATVTATTQGEGSNTRTSGSEEAPVNTAATTFNTTVSSPPSMVSCTATSPPTDTLQFPAMSPPPSQEYDA